MIHIKKDFSKPPAKLVKCALKREKNLLENAKVDPNCYKEAKSALNKLYHGKCAFCESKLGVSSYMEIEHYRPKNKESYYWLAYEWSNLLPICRICNSKKGTQFPVKNYSKLSAPINNDGKLDKTKCIADQLPLINQEARLIHPEIDFPENHLIINTDGSIASNNNSEKALETINKYFLKRKELQIGRKKVIDSVFDDIKRVFKHFTPKLAEKHQKEFKKALVDEVFNIKSKEVSNQEYSFVAFCIKNNMKKFVKVHIDNVTQQNYILKAFDIAYNMDN